MSLTEPSVQLAVRGQHIHSLSSIVVRLHQNMLDTVSDGAGFHLRFHDKRCTIQNLACNNLLNLYQYLFEAII